MTQTGPVDPVEQFRPDGDQFWGLARWGKKGFWHWGDIEAIQVEMIRIRMKKHAHLQPSEMTPEVELNELSGMKI